MAKRPTDPIHFANCSGCGKRFHIYDLDTRHVVTAAGEWVREKPGLWCETCYGLDGSTGFQRTDG